MRLLTIRVLGFQSFSDSGAVDFGQAINLVVGQNNSGKSSLLRSMQPVFADDRHRSASRYQDHLLENPSVLLSIQCSGSELLEAILKHREPYYIPVPMTEKDQFLDRLWTSDTLIFAVQNAPGNTAFESTTRPSHGLPLDGDAVTAVVQGNQGKLQVIATEMSGNDNLARAIYHMWQSRMFFFTAERYAIGLSPPGAAERLAPNASNLPAVLHTLSGTRGTLFQKLVQHLREIFPTVGNLSVRPTPTNQIEVRLWPTEEMNALELSFPLNESGTGVAQALAILAAIMTTEAAVIIIDEINSFLHPSAAKALLRIIQTEYPQHQYIISTHAPEVIGFSNPKLIHLVKRAGYESTVEPLALDEVERFREVADHLGVSMTDVFAAERVVWVEGPTEELCFPFIYRELIGPLPRGLLMVSVAATGDFFAKRRDREVIYEIYSRLSSASAALTISVAFSFDTEELSPDDKERMIKDSRGRMHFLPRRHLECYLVNAEGIAEFINERDLSDERVTGEAVTKELERLAIEEPFRVSNVTWAGDLDDPKWLRSVDAARLIKTAVENLSEHRVTFAKKDDSLRLLRYVLTHRPEAIDELKDYVAGLVRATP
jgi:predicted ATPase